MSADAGAETAPRAMLRLVALAEESAESDAAFALRCARAAARLTPPDARALVCAAELEAARAPSDARAHEVALRLFQQAAKLRTDAAADASGLCARALHGVVRSARALGRPADEARALCGLAAVDGAASGWEAVALRARAAQAAADAGELSAALSVLRPADGAALPAEGLALLALNEAQLSLAAAADAPAGSDADACAVAAQIGGAFERAAAALAASPPSRFAVGVRAHYQALALLAALSAPRAASACAPLPPLARAGGGGGGGGGGEEAGTAASGGGDVPRRFGAHASGLRGAEELLSTAFSTADDAAGSADARARCGWLDARALAAARCGLGAVHGLRLGEDILKTAPAGLPTGAAQSAPELAMRVLAHCARAACAAQRCVFTQYVAEATAGCELLTAAAGADAPARTRALALALAPSWHLLLSTGATFARRGAAASAHAAAALRGAGVSSPLEAWASARADAAGVGRRKRPREPPAVAPPAADAHALALSLQHDASALDAAEADAASAGAGAEQRGALAARLDAVAASVRGSVAALAAISAREGHAANAGGAWPAAVAFGLCVLARAQLAAAAVRGDGVGADVRRDADSAYILAHRLKDAQLLVHALSSLAAAEPGGPYRATLDAKAKMFGECADVSAQHSAAQWAALDAWRLAE